ncbi:hypothetical protein PLESTB_000640100 [Pleodorina starrii]|uniref:Uncharacterized protein n=1 Tax=Pleodorina starrii TaxID=330485 RepID=A0A9W6BIB2_9CHLO|nr:hypothetical protein PLESTB_000640100 [Pleodorina starrii]GLC71533.1 hypothetical protein PLESTF_001132200 [Pleodorina starrii]
MAAHVQQHSASRRTVSRAAASLPARRLRFCGPSALAPTLTRALALLAVCLLALGRLPPASARPSYWTLYVPGASCTSHPDRDLKGLGAPHGTPRTDESITFTLLDSAGAPTSKACPGAQYTLTGSFASPPSSETQIDTPRW